jgi:hypothetical protein
MHPNILPTELAYKLFETMLDRAESWKRNRWWLFERAVESPHKSSFYVRDMSLLADSVPEYPVSSTEPNEVRQAAHYW